MSARSASGERLRGDLERDHERQRLYDGLAMRGAAAATGTERIAYARMHSGRSPRPDGPMCGRDMAAHVQRHEQLSDRLAMRARKRVECFLGFATIGHGTAQRLVPHER